MNLRGCHLDAKTHATVCKGTVKYGSFLTNVTNFLIIAAAIFVMIKAFERRTAIPVLLNTSFNENEPIVESPGEAVDCFLRTKMDVLAAGPFFCVKKG